MVGSIAELPQRLEDLGAVTLALVPKPGHSVVSAMIVYELVLLLFVGIVISIAG